MRTGLNTVHIDGKRIFTKYGREELARRVLRASELIKQMMGIVNNAAWSVALEAHDKIKQSPRYRHKVKQSFRRVFELFKAYEYQLMFSERKRLFHVADLHPELKQRYADITDADFYEYWCASGATAYARKKAWFVRLRNRYYLFLEKHGAKESVTVSWGMLADACLKMAAFIYKYSIATAAKQNDVPQELLDVIFGSLNMEALAEQWDKALTELEPKTDIRESDTIEAKNIELAVEELVEQLTDLSTLRESLTETAESYEELFRTEEERKKILMEIQGLR